MMNYQESIYYLESLARFGIKLGLKRIERLLEILGQPQEKYHTVHVTGTNGKGSVSVMLATIATKSGCRTGLYTSPHLETYRERFQIDGQDISEADFAKYFTTVREAMEKMVNEGEECPTQFEALTALAFLYFAGKKVEYAIVEVGLGGLLDSTNVIVPLISVITNVTMEHADRCGGTLEGIAHHKAGIIKPGVPVVTAATGLPLEIIQQTAVEKNADVFVAGDDFRSDFVRMNDFGQELEFSSGLVGVSKAPYSIRLLGMHQKENSSLVFMAAELLHNLDERFTLKTITQAFYVVRWPGRFEQFELDGQKIVVDGAHNPAGMAALRQSLDSCFPDRERVFLMGILKDKDYGSMLNIILSPADKVVLTVPESERAEDPEILALKIHNNEVLVEHGQDTALNKAIEMAGGKRLLCITGSLYLIGKIRRLLLDKMTRLEK